MDQLTAFVTVARRRLRLRRILMAIERNPKILENDKMPTPFLQGLTKAMDMLEHDLETDAKGLMTKIESVGQRGKAAIAKGHSRIDGVASRVAEVDKFVTAIEGSNGGDPLEGSSGSSGGQQAQVSSLPEDKQVVASEEIGKVEDVLTEPEKLTVNGVSGG